VVDLALKTLLHDKLRFLMTVAGVAFADTLILVQLGLFTGLLDNATVTIEHLDADIWVTSKNTPNVDFAHAFSEAHVQRIRSVPGVARADNLIVTFMDLALPTGARETTLVYALEDFSRWGLPWNVVEGDPKDLKRGGYMILDDSATRRFGAFKTGEYREVLAHRLKIIGRSKEALSFTTTPVSFMDFRVAQNMIPSYLSGQTTYILVKLAPGASSASVCAEIERRYPYHDVHTKAEWAAISRAYWLETTGIGFNMFLTVFLGCLVGVVVVAQTLYASTMEHLKEFGTVKAIGGGNLDIYVILAKQSSLAALVGFALGMLPPFLLKPLVTLVGLRLVLTPGFAAAVFLGTLALCLGAAMISFRKVASIDPALVFRG
jgi:putative ABC transport system permease protein